MTENPEEKKVRMVVTATRAFRRDGEPSEQTLKELEQALASVGARTVELGYKSRMRIVEISENAAELLKGAVGEKFVVGKEAFLNINI